MKTDYANYFYNITDGSEDLHLRHDDNQLWGTDGADLDEDGNLPVTNDIDGDSRDSTQPDIGADEVTNDVANSPETPYCEGATNPGSVSDETPEFSAICDDDDGDGCEYYEIEVNTTTDFSAGGDMWDTDKTTLGGTVSEGARSSDISYAGTSLCFGGQTYYWRIRFWDAEHDGSADTSVPGDWTAAQQFTLTTSYQLTFSTEPTTSYSCEELVNQPVVRLEDACGTLQSGDSTTQVEMTIGTNPGSATLLGTTTVTASSGVATFTDLQIAVPGTGYTLVASDGTVEAPVYSSDTTAGFLIEPCTTPMAQVVYEHATGDLIVMCWLQGPEGRVVLDASDTCA
ncbi:MAG: hypothetical protein KAI25_09410, partial [Hyphomicrobiaceae bacterium]|nr:hypothetical protein [Hyphomicrobiaceae bacterium]